MKYIRYLLILLGLLLTNPSFAATYTLPNNDNSLVGSLRKITVPSGTNITELGLKYDVGYLEFFEANPRKNLASLQSDSHLVVPTQFILPDVAHKGIVINVAELRMYYFPPDKNIVITYPVGVGRKQLGSETPIFKSYIAEKREHPIWIPTPDTRVEAYEKGVTLPDFVDAGPENPLGDYAMRLGTTAYLIHGTNNPAGVGKRSSGGCIRMYPDDIEQLFHSVDKGTPVNIIDEHFKAGFLGKNLYLEAHVPIDLKHGRTHNTLREATRVLMPLVRKYNVKVDWEKVLHVANEQRGIPEVVGYR